MRCLKAFCERIAARDIDRQTTGIPIRVALINRFNALDTRHRRGRPRGLSLNGTAALTLQAAFLQHTIRGLKQCPEFISGRRTQGCKRMARVWAH